MNIGLDLDGTITNPYYWLEFFNNLFNKNLTEKDCIKYNLCEIYGVGNDMWDVINKQHIKGYLDSVDIREDAIEIINKLKQKHNCSFITARSDTEYIRNRTIEYLTQNNLDNIPLYMLSSHYKVDKAKELNIEVFVEDSLSNALELSANGIKVFLINTNYNQGELNENIIRVNNWHEIYQEIESWEV